MPQLATFTSRVPVCIVTGFLGAGKTTLLNSLLAAGRQQSTDANPDGLHIAVVENECGEVNIDQTLVGDQLTEREDLVSIAGGCVCCSLRKDIVKAFAKLLQRSAVRQRPLDYILFETTGLADPSPVAFTFFSNPWIAARFKLDSITCVVDAKHLLQHLEDGQHGGQGAINEAVQQIAFADLILLSKVDMVSSADKQDVLDAIRRINNTARILECQLNSEQHRPPLHEVLGTNSFSVQRALTVDPTFLDTDSDHEGSAPGADHAEGSGERQQQQHQHQQHQCEHDHVAEAQQHEEELRLRAHKQQEQQQEEAPAGGAAGQAAAERAEGVEAEGELSGPGHKRLREAQPCQCSPDSAHEKQPKRRRKKLHDLSDVSSVGITTRGQLDEYRFNMFMRDLLSEKAKDIFRCKGILCVHGYGAKKFVFQGVHETICYGPAEVPWQEGEPRINQIVFIGRGLDRKTLTEGFRTCLWQPLPDGWEEALDDFTKKPYYWNKRTGEKSWLRPTPAQVDALADVTSHHALAQQPAALAPRASALPRTAQSLPSNTPSTTNNNNGGGAAGGAAGGGSADGEQGSGAAAAGTPVAVA